MEGIHPQVKTCPAMAELTFPIAADENTLAELWNQAVASIRYGFTRIWVQCFLTILTRFFSLRFLNTPIICAVDAPHLIIFIDFFFHLGNRSSNAVMHEFRTIKMFHCWPIKIFFHCLFLCRCTEEIFFQRTSHYCNIMFFLCFLFLKRNTCALQRLN